MAVLVVEPIDAEVMAWLAERHGARFAPELVQSPREFRQALFNVRALILPASLTVDAQTLHYAPVLRAVGRVQAGAENIDLDACARAGVEVVRSADAAGRAEAEFMIGALLAMLRRVPVTTEQGQRVGRELGSATVGLIGMGPTARVLSDLLDAFGAEVIGYDPAVHSSDPLWEQAKARPVGLAELMAQSDAVCVQLGYFSRYRGLLGERYLAACKVNQVLVSVGHSSLFDEAALADVLNSGRMAAAWLDSLEPGAMDPGRPLHEVGGLQISPRVASTTRESLVRSAWSVARRLDEILQTAPVARPNFRSTSPSAAIDLELGPTSA